MFTRKNKSFFSFPVLLPCLIIFVMFLVPYDKLSNLQESQICIEVLKYPVQNPQFYGSYCVIFLLNIK